MRGVIEDINYQGWLEENCNDLAQAERRMQNVDELVEWFARMRDDEDQPETLADMVARMTLLGILERDSGENDADAVHLMTLHAAKGLEFDHVFLVGMEEELLPHKNALEDDMLEEERRLAYVGITRARKSLTFTLARKRRRYGEDVSCEPSRFLGELPQDELEWEGAGVQVDPETRQNRARAHLANLRDMLDT